MKKFQNTFPLLTTFFRCWAIFFLVRLFSLLIFRAHSPTKIAITGSVAAVTSLAALLLLCTVAPIAEELLFRAMAFKILSPMPEKLRIFSSAILFAAAHNVTNILPVFALGVLLGAEYNKSGSLKNCILLHATTNLVDGVFLSRFPVWTILFLCGGAVVACSCRVCSAIRGRTKKSASP